MYIEYRLLQLVKGTHNRKTHTRTDFTDEYKKRVNFLILKQEL